MTSMNNRGSLQDQAAAQKSTIAGRIVEMSTASIREAGLTDRLRDDSGALDELTANIEAIGQEVPVIVRPDAFHPGTYLIVAGRRRLEACRRLGRRVKAEIRELSDEAALIVQGSENSCRKDLTFIETARFAAKLVDQEGLPASKVDVIYGCDESVRSRFLKIGRGLPEDLAVWIGRAEKVGRPRWETLVNAMTEDPALVDRMRAVLATANPEMKSAARFKLLHEIAVGASSNGETALTVEGREEPLGRARIGPKSMRFTFNAAAAPGFVAWLAADPSRITALLLEAYERESRADAPCEVDEQ